MPPPGGMAGIGVSFFGFSATIASVVISSPAIEAAPCRAVRTTLVGSHRIRLPGHRSHRSRAFALIRDRPGSSIPYIFRTMMVWR